jgi:hypothetical protein
VTAPTHVAEGFGRTGLRPNAFLILTVPSLCLLKSHVPTLQAMDHVPESSATTDILRWLAYERDAAWAAKLAILRAASCADIRHFGACLHEHNRHAEELGALARAADGRIRIPAEPSFITSDPCVVGAIDDGRALLHAMERLEAVRIDRYVGRCRAGADQLASMLHGLLDRHLADARARLDRLRGLREWRHDRAA